MHFKNELFYTHDSSSYYIAHCKIHFRNNIQTNKNDELKYIYIYISKVLILFLWETFYTWWCSSSIIPFGLPGVLGPGVGGHEGPLGESVLAVVIVDPLRQDHGSVYKYHENPDPYRIWKGIRSII